MIFDTGGLGLSVDKDLILGHIRHFELGAVGNVEIVKLIDIFHNDSLLAVRAR